MFQSSHISSADLRLFFDLLKNLRFEKIKILKKLQFLTPARKVTNYLSLLIYLKMAERRS